MWKKISYSLSLGFILLSFCIIFLSPVPAEGKEYNPGYFLGLMITVVATFVSIQTYKTSRLQRFENTFFNMLNLQQQITNDLIYNSVVQDETKTTRSNTIKGRELFGYFWDTLRMKSKSEDGSDDVLDDSEETFTGFKYGKGMNDLLSRFGANEYDLQKTPSYFDHYFRHLYTIIKFVHYTDFLTLKEKYKYVSIVRATLSRYELVWIYYNCIYGPGKKKFKPLVEKYALLKNIREEFLALSRDNYKILEFKGQKGNFTDTDYEFFLTDEKDENKFHISAFYSIEEMDKGKDLVNRWNDFLNQTQKI